VLFKTVASDLTKIFTFLREEIVVAHSIPHKTKCFTIGGRHNFLEESEGPDSGDNSPLGHLKQFSGSPRIK
jgi:hypothetical protein